VGAARRIVIVLLVAALARAQDDLAEGLAEASAEAVLEDGTLGLLLARKALETADVEPARTAVYTALVRTRERAVLLGHKGPVVFGDISPDGKAFATASEDGTARLWDADGKETATLPAGAPVKEVRFFGAAVLAATGAELTIWDRAGGKLAAFPAAPYAVMRESVVIFPAAGTARLVDANGKVLKEVKARHCGPGAGDFAFYAVAADGRLRWYDHRGREKAVTPASGTTRAVFAASAPLVATFGSGIAVELWSPECKKLGSLLHAGPVEQVSISPAGDRILTASADGHYAFWTPDGKREQRVPKPGPCLFAALSRDGRRALTLDDRDRVTLWVSGAESATRRFESVRRADLGAGVIVEFEDGTRRIADAKLGDVDPAYLLKGAMTVCRWGQRGDWLLVGDERGRAALQHWSRVGPKDLDGHTGAILHGCSTEDDRLILTTSRDSTARVWVVDPPGTPLLYHPDRVNGVGCDPATGRLLTCCGPLIHFREPDGRLLREATLPSPMIWWGHGDQRVAAACRGEPFAWLWDLDGKEIARLKHDGPLNGAEVSRNGDLVVTFSADKTARLWDARGKLVATLVHPAGVGSAAFSDDSSLVLTTADDRDARLWSADGKLQATFHLPEAIWYCVFSPKGDRLVGIPTAQGIPRIWTSRGEEIRALEGHEGQVRAARFSPEGDAVVTSSADTTARVWDADGRPREVLPHPDEVYTAFFLPEGRGIITTCKDGSVRHWDREGNLLAVMHGHTRAVWLLDCTKDGSWLATGSEDSTVRLWPLRREDLLRIARERLCREFTPEERERYRRLLE
jgi:WD40 repeat protein